MIELEIITLIVRDKLWSRMYEEGTEQIRMFMTSQRRKFQWDSTLKFPSETTVMTASPVVNTLKVMANRPTPC